MTLVRDVLARDITRWEIPNLGVAKVGPPQDDAQWRILKHELESFVADGEYGAGLERMLTTYLSYLERDSQPAAWVSGFYGSGKSHLVRVLDSIWADRQLPDGARAQGIVNLPDSTKALLRELDTRSRQFGGRFSAAGTLSAGGTNVGLAILSIVFTAAGLPEDLAPARLVLWLRKEGIEQAVIAHLEANGRSFHEELNDLYVSEPLAEAILAAKPGQATSAAALLDRLPVEYPSVDAIPEHTFMDVLERTLKSMSPTGEVPLSLIVLDEVQQFIGDSLERAHDVQVLVEAISSKLRSRVMVVATGQMALRATPVLQKLMDRFTLEVNLKDKDVDQVLRSVVLRKHNDRVSEIGRVLEQVSGEIDRQLAGSAVGPMAADKADLVADYPLLPARRRLSERILRALDTSGRSGQLRTQLRLTLDAAKAVAGRELGVVVAIDRVYDDQESGLQQSGALPPTTAQLIASLDDGTEDGRLAARVAKVVYLLNRLPADGPMSVGLRATPDTIADLLIEDLRTDGARVRERVPQAVASLLKSSVLQRLEGGALILQTPEGVEWNGEYQGHATDLAGDSRWLAERRDQLLKDAFATVERTLDPRQGTSRTRRKAKAAFTQDQPASTTGEVPIWVRDEWSTSLRSVRDDAQRLTADDALVLVWIPREQADQLRDAMVEAEAAHRTVERRPVPATQEGKDARQGLISRRTAAREAEVRLAARIVSGARVFQAGGDEIDAGATGGGLAQMLQRAVDNAVIRLYPAFGPVDHGNWQAVLKRIKEGGANPLTPIGHPGEVEEHPAAKQVLAFLGAGGKRGLEVRKAFDAPPYGWSQDAIDALLLALCASGRVLGRYNGDPLDVQRIAQNQLGAADFRSDEVPFPISARMRLKGLGQTLGVPVTNVSDPEIARGILARLRSLCDAAGGDAPLPARPVPEEIRELESMSGNAQLAALAERREQLESLAIEWRSRAERIPVRMAAWDQARRLVRHADGLPEAAEADRQLSAIAGSRSLLTDPDPVAPVTALLAEALRSRLTDQVDAYRSARQAALTAIEANPGWSVIEPADRTTILRQCELDGDASLAIGTTDELLRALDGTPLSGWADRIDAVPAKVDRAFKEIVSRTTKAPRPVAVPRAVITDMADLERYFDEVRRLVQPHLDNDETVML